jgi:intracellular sulfur oxidation DsrE/DsrF family protein
MFGVFLQAQDIYKVVYDLTTTKLATIENRFIKGIVTNKNHYENHLKELDVVVIIHGDAYKFFVEDPKKTVFKDDKEINKADKSLKSRLQSLAETYDVKFKMCQAGATRHKLSRENIHPFVEMVPNAVIGLIDAQNDGYAYAPVD